MAKNTSRTVEADPAERGARLAEERFLLATQVEMQRLLNDNGLKYKDLARRLSVSEARVSQMFGDDANNLTIRTIAKIFYQLGEKPVIMSKAVYDRRLAEARGARDPSPAWVFAGSVDDFLDVTLSTRMVAEVSHGRDTTRPASGSDWAQAEIAVEARRADAA